MVFKGSEKIASSDPILSGVRSHWGIRESPIAKNRFACHPNRNAFERVDHPPGAATGRTKMKA